MEIFVKITSPFSPYSGVEGKIVEHNPSDPRPFVVDVDNGETISFHPSEFEIVTREKMREIILTEEDCAFIYDVLETFDMLETRDSHLTWRLQDIFGSASGRRPNQESYLCRLEEEERERVFEEYERHNFDEEYFKKNWCPTCMTDMKYCGCEESNEEWQRKLLSSAKKLQLVLPFGYGL